jgi:membrane associated rhomboid family serine protease
MTNTTDSPNPQPPKAEIGGFLVDFFRKPGARPWVTYAVIAVCAAIWVYFNVPQESPFYHRAREVLAPPGVMIWKGAYWGLITAPFVHFDAFHILFNMWWLRDFGAVLEPTMGRVRYLLFIVTAAILASGAELAVEYQTGIGFSGVVYAMFGYLLAARNVEPLYRKIVTKGTAIWLLGWLVLCIVLTYTHVWRVANAAHIVGFLFGYCVANVFRVRAAVVPNLVALVAMVALTVLSVTYMPWSKVWKDRDAYATIIAVRDEASRGRPDAQYAYATILIQYGKRAEAVPWLKKSAEQEYVPAMNGLAWTLATDRNSALRNGPEAVKLAEKACERSNWKTAEYVDTLAAAYAEVGRWDDAVKAQRRAIDIWGDGKADIKASFESRLQRYLRHEKARE